MEKLQFTIHVEVEDMHDFLKYHLKSRMLRLLLRLSPLYLLMIFVSLVDWAMLIFVLLLLPLFQFAYIPYLIKRRAKKEHELNYSGLKTAECCFDLDGGKVVTEMTQSKFSWEAFYKIVECKSIFLLYSNQEIATIIPKRNLSDQAVLLLRQMFAQQENVKVELLK